MKRLLVTGLDGFVGRHVRQALESSRDGPFQLAETRSAIELTEPVTVKQAIEESRPDCVLHLAAQSFIPESLANPRATYEVNFLGTHNVMQALKLCGFGGRVLYVSSADVYGAVRDEELPIVESFPLRPCTPYGVSKAAAELLCYQWTQEQHFDIVLARPFNHIGAGQGERFVVADFARQIIEIKLGRREPLLTVGAIDVTRDFTDVRDVVQAYFVLLERGRTGEAYNVCSGREYSIREVLEGLIRLAGVECEIVVDSARLRAVERKRSRGSFEKLAKCTGWNPHITLTESLRDILSYWEMKLQHG